jgi:hypothetical protein
MAPVTGGTTRKVQTGKAEVAVRGRFEAAKV